MVKEWLVSRMFNGDARAGDKADRIVLELGDHAVTLSHARHISITKAQEIGINATPLEASQDFQEAISSVHHACVQTLDATGAYKIIENHKGVVFMQMLAQRIISAPGPN
jgi:hypothetical protein